MSQLVRQESAGSRVPITAGGSGLSNDDKLLLPAAGTRKKFYLVHGDIAANGTGVAIVGPDVIVELPKDTTTGVFAIGAEVFWDAGDGECDVAAAGNYSIGEAVEAVIAADTTVKVRLHGMLMDVET